MNGNLLRKKKKMEILSMDSVGKKRKFKIDCFNETKVVQIK